MRRPEPSPDPSRPAVLADHAAASAPGLRPNQLMTAAEVWARRVVWVVFGAVVAYDLVVGSWLLFGAEPWRAHGESPWLSLPGDHAVEGLLRRLGALQLTAAALLAAGLWAGRRDARAIDGVLIAVVVVGGGLAWTDATYFAGTSYHLVKQVIGGVTTLAMLAWAVARFAGWRSRRARQE